MTQAHKRYVESWLQKANNDLASAARLLEIEPMILDTACFHCQQAVEKSLKGYLCYIGEEIIKTHDVDYLIQQCKMFDNDFGKIETDNLNEYAVNGRYPGDSILPDADEAKKLYEIAAIVFSMVKEKIIFENK